MPIEGLQHGVPGWWRRDKREQGRTIVEDPIEAAIRRLIHEAEQRGHGRDGNVVDKDAASDLEAPADVVPIDDGVRERVRPSDHAPR
jgi:hypothetical protein